MCLLVFFVYFAKGANVSSSKATPKYLERKNHSELVWDNVSGSNSQGMFGKGFVLGRFFRFYARDRILLDVSLT